MSKTIKRDSRTVRRANSKLKAIKRSATTTKETSVILYGSVSDPEVQLSLQKISKTRSAEVQPRPSFDTGLGQCGKHLCNCKTICKKELAPVAFQGDTGASMGMSY
jgi:hypothetical protein